jgi:hypothetical protein
MGQLLFPDRKKINGPWLLNRKDLERLGEVLEKIYEIIEDSVLQEVQQKVYEQNKNSVFEEEKLEKEISKNLNLYEYSKKVKEIKIVSEEGTILVDESLKNVLKDRALINLKPNMLKVELQRGLNNRFQLSISKIYDGELEYHIDCFSPNIKDDIKYEIDKWTEELNPTRVLQSWSKYGDLISLMAFFPLIILFILSFLKSYTSYSEVLYDDAVKILRVGIDSTNRDDAIELLLKYNSGYIPENFVAIEKSKDPIYVRLLSLNLFFLIVGIVRPKTTLGIAKRKFLYSFYKFWIKFILVTIPVALILTPIWEMIVGWIY